jgi:hypothetical protein
MVDKDGMEQFINGIDGILQIQLEEFKSDKEEIATRKDSSLANRRSFRYGMYAVVGLSVTSLIGLGDIGIFKTLFERLLIFIIGAVIGLAIFHFFGSYLRKTKDFSLLIDEAYNKAIYHASDLRIAYNSLEMNAYDINDLFILNAYNAISLGPYREHISNEIAKGLEEKYYTIMIFHKSHREMLLNKKNRQDVLIEYANKLNDLRKNDFKKKNELLQQIKNLLPIDDSIKLKLELAQDEEEEELENYTRVLVNELREIKGINNVSYITKQEKIPEGARAGEIVSLGEIGISFITSGALAASLSLISEWLKSRKRKIKIETKNGTVEADNLSKDEMDKILNLVKRM